METILNTKTTRNCAFGILILISMLAFSGCSQKPSSEEIAAQVKTALAEEKAKEQAAVPAPAPVAEATTKQPAATAKHTSRHTSHAKADLAQHEAPPPKIACDNCGVVISIKEVEQEGKGSGMGVIAGGLAGGLAGNQVGNGTGRDLATLAGIVGGAIAGNKIEEKVKKTHVYDVTVKMENGEEHVLRYKTAPGVMAGDKIRIEGENIVRQ